MDPCKKRVVMLEKKKKNKQTKQQHKKLHVYLTEAKVVPFSTLSALF